MISINTESELSSQYCSNKGLTYSNWLPSSLWRPLIEVVEDAPLVFADRRTVKRSDYIPFDRVLNDRVVEELYLLHRPYHNWFWLSKQKCTEPVMFITWDSLSMGSDGDQSVGKLSYLVQQ